MNMQQLEDEFAFLENWEDRYRHVIEMGKAMPALTASERIGANLVNGCVSQAWLCFTWDENKHLQITGDSDAHIVRGLLALVIHLLQGLDANEVVATDIRGFFDRIGLAENLSPQRANGLLAMIARIHKFAAAAII